MDKPDLKDSKTDNEKIKVVKRKIAILILISKFIVLSIPICFISLSSNFLDSKFITLNLFSSVVYSFITLYFFAIAMLFSEIIIQIPILRNNLNKYENLKSDILYKNNTLFIMNKPELKDYDLDEIIVKKAKRQTEGFIALYCFVVIFLFINLVYFIKVNIFPFSRFSPIVFILISLSWLCLMVAGEWIIKLLLSKHVSSLDKYEKYKRDLNYYLSHQKKDNNNNSAQRNYNYIYDLSLLSNYQSQQKNDTNINSSQKNHSISKTERNIIKKPSVKINTKEPSLSKGEAKNEIFFEGTKSVVKLTKYERNAKARKLCIEYHKCKCYICEISLEKEYGSIAEGFIQVHHIKPLSEIGKAYQVDPIKDLIPICPNCHSVIHSKNPPYTILQMKKIIEEEKKKPSRKQ